MWGQVSCLCGVVSSVYVKASVKCLCGVVSSAYVGSSVKCQMFVWRVSGNVTNLLMITLPKLIGKASSHLFSKPI